MIEAKFPPFTTFSDLLRQDKEDTVFDFRGAEAFPKPKGYEEANKEFKWDREKENWVRVPPDILHTPAEFRPENWRINLEEYGFGSSAVEKEEIKQAQVDLNAVCRSFVEDMVKETTLREDLLETTNKFLDSQRHTQVGGTHYEEMDVQPWTAMRAWMSPEEYCGYHVGTVIGYLSRHKKKGSEQDIRKAKHHLEELVRYFEEEGEYPW